MTENDFLTALPIEIVSVMALVLMLVDSFVPRSSRILSVLSILALSGGIVGSCVTLLQREMHGFGGLIATGAWRNVFDIIFCTAGILTVLLARDYLRRVGAMFDEFYTLLMMSIAGMMMMAHANDFMILFVGLEVMSIAFYVMAGLVRRSLSSNEASMKYFLLGAFASGFLLYGIALIYGATGGTSYTTLARGVADTEFPVLLWGGVALLIVGLGFKVAAFPFHQWAPDVYHGAPTVVTGFMSTAGKAAAFAGFLGAMAPIFAAGAAEAASVRTVLGLIAAASMLAGNIIAIAQTNIKRMLAYSSVAHAGYMMIGLASGTLMGYTGIMYYLAAYLFMQIGAFAIVGMLEKENGGMLGIGDYRGLGRRRPGLAMSMAIFMFSLTGIPPFAGFFGKYMLFAAAVSSHMTWLAVVGVLSSVISAWFYLGLIVTMFFREPSEASEQSDVERLTFGGAVAGAIALAIIGTITVGFIPDQIMRLGGY